MAEEAAAQPAAVQLREIGSDDVVRRFRMETLDGGNPYLPLTIFLQRDAKKHNSMNVAKTYVGLDGQRVIGYISISCSQIALEAPLAQELAGYPYEFPAVKIGKLAVDHRHRKLGLGGQLVDFAVAIVKNEIEPKVSCRFIIVDAHKLAVEFYQKKGFTLLDTEKNKARPAPLMFLDIGKLG